MNKSMKMTILTLLILGSIVCLFFSVRGAVDNPEYEVIEKVEKTQMLDPETLTVQDKNVKIKYEDKSNPMIAVNYILFIKIEAFVIGFAACYVFMSDFCDKKNEVIFENKSIIFTYVIISIVLMELVSAVSLILTKSMMF